jgi:hypothetical protein
MRGVASLALVPPVVLGVIVFCKAKFGSTSWGDVFWCTALGVSIAGTSLGLMFSQFNNGLTRVGGNVAVNAVNEVSSGNGTGAGSATPNAGVVGGNTGGAAVGGQAGGGVSSGQTAPGQ